MECLKDFTFLKLRASKIKKLQVQIEYLVWAVSSVKIVKLEIPDTKSF